MTYSPQKNIKANCAVILAMILIFAASVIIVNAFSLPDVIWQSTFFVLAVIICELLVKYFLPQYTYVYDENSFIITKDMGKKSVMVCNIDTDRIVALYTKEEYKKQEHYSPKSIYNYNCNLVARPCYVLIFEYSFCCEAVVFEADEKMAQLILSRIKNQ